MNRLGEEHGVDPARACPRDDVWQHPQAQAVMVAVIAVLIVLVSLVQFAGDFWVGRLKSR